jgi:hypothetical protein
MKEVRSLNSGERPLNRTRDGQQLQLDCILRNTCSEVERELEGAVIEPCLEFTCEGAKSKQQAGVGVLEYGNAIWTRRAKTKNRFRNLAHIPHKGQS